MWPASNAMPLCSGWCLVPSHPNLSSRQVLEFYKLRGSEGGHDIQEELGRLTNWTTTCYHIPAMVDPDIGQEIQENEICHDMSTLKETLLAKNEPLSNFWKSWGRCPHTPVRYVKHPGGWGKSTSSCKETTHATCWVVENCTLSTTASQIPKKTSEYPVLLKNGCVEVPWYSRDAFSNLLALSAFSLFRLSQSPSQDQQITKCCTHHISWCWDRNLLCQAPPSLGRCVSSSTPQKKQTPNDLRLHSSCESAWLWVWQLYLSQL